MSDKTNNNMGEKAIINRFERTEENSVIDSETLQKYSVDSILTDEENRTLWINGMPFGNAYIHFNGNSVSGPQPTHAEIFNDFDNNIALGNYSHAEGYGTEANGTRSHAEGNGTIAGGADSHAEGSGTKAEGDCAHAEGIATNAGGVYSHAEGYGTEASGIASHAEGGGWDSTNKQYLMGGTAKGHGSHAEGIGTIANNSAEHASGKYNVSNTSSTIFSVGIGENDNNRKNAFEIQYNNGGKTIISTQTTIGTGKLNPKNTTGTALNIAGDVYIEGNLKTTGTHTIVNTETENTNELHVTGETQLDGNTIIGANLEVTGETQLKGNTAIGDSNTDKLTVTGESIFSNTVTINDKEIATTNETSEFSVSLGAKTTAGLKGFRYTGVSDGAEDGGKYKLIVDDYNGEYADDKILSICNNAKYEYALKIIDSDTGYIVVDVNAGVIDPFENGIPTIDNESISSLDDFTIWCHTEPTIGNINLGVGATAFGDETQATNWGAYSEGRKTHAYGQYSHAEGRETKAGYAAHAEGRETIASGNLSHAEGRETVASGTHSHAEGRKTIASNLQSHAEGYMSTATGENSHAEGYKSQATVFGSHAEGIQSKAEGSGAHAEGGYIKDGSTYVSGGIATGGASHAEGVETKASGMDSHAEGYMTQAINNHAHAEGHTTIAKGGASHAEGRETYAFGNYSHAEGFGNAPLSVDLNAENAGANIKTAWESNKKFNVAVGAVSHVEGKNNLAYGDRSHAGGNQTEAVGANSFAHGDNVKTTNDNEVALGKYNVSRGGTIFSVGIGTSDKEADRKNAIEVCKDNNNTSYNTYINTQTTIKAGDAKDTDVLTIVGNVRIEGNLTTTGESTESSEQTVDNLHVTGTTNLDGNTKIGTEGDSANLEVTGGLTVKGETALNGKTNITSGGLNVTGDTTITNGGLTVGGNTNITSGGLNVTGATGINGGLTVKGETTLNGKTNITSGGLNVSDGAEITGGLNVTGDTTITNGDVYLGADSNGNNPCNYPAGENTTSITLQRLIKDQTHLDEVTYAKLKEMRDGGTLAPGKFYRITDYITRTTQQNTISAAHQFDIVVLALSKNTLSEDAWAIQHNFDDPESDEAKYFKKSNLAAWKIKYCLDNDRDRFLWASSLRNTGNYISGYQHELVEYYNKSKSNLQEILFNNNSTIGPEDFYRGYTNLEFVYISGDTKVETDNYSSRAFIGCNKLKTICVKSQNIYTSEFSSCGELQNIYLECSSELRLHPYAFNNCGTSSQIINIYIHADNIIFYDSTGKQTSPADITAFIAFLFGTPDNYKNKQIKIYCNESGFQSLKKYNNGNVSVTQRVAVDPCPLSDDQQAVIADIEYSNYPEISIKINDAPNILNHTGVIYRMIDEFGNDCPFDFKNIKILSDADNEYRHVITGGTQHISTDGTSYAIDGSDWSLEGNAKNNRICNTGNTIPRIYFVSYSRPAISGAAPIYTFNNTIINSDNITITGSNNSYIINKNETNLSNINGTNQFIFGGDILANNVYQSNQ